MKKLSFVLGVLITIFIWSCGGGSATEEKEEVQAKKEVYSLETEEGMMKKLKEFKIEVPDKFTFIEIKHKSAGGYTATFKIEGMDEATTTEILAWYDQKCVELVEDGWRRRTIRDGDKMVGLIYNQDLFYNDPASLSMSSAYDPAENSYSLYLQPDD